MEMIQEERKFILQVDTSDMPLGLIEKKEAHVRGVLHRAFSVFIFRKVGPSCQLLLQQRAFGKYHSGGLWTNTCCSHADPYAPVEETAEIRLQTEMGFTCPLAYLGSFYYKADVGNGMTEHEIDHVFAAFNDPIDIRPDPEEAHAFKWIDIDDLEKQLSLKPHEFTAWFPEAYQMALKFLALTPATF